MLGREFAFLLSSVGSRLKLSSPIVCGMRMPWMSATVAKTSVKQIVFSLIAPARTRPGQRTMNGMRCPAS